MYHPPDQYQSQGTEEPTITLGNQYDVEPPKAGGRGRPKEYPFRNLMSQQQAQNLRYQYQKEVEICHSEMQALKEQIQLDEKEKIVLEETIIHLKRQRAASDNESRRLFQQNQRNRQLVQKLKIDNKSMEMEIDKFKSERKSYYTNLSNIEAIKQDISKQIAEKNTNIDELANKLRKVQRNHSDCRFRIEELENQCILADKEKEQLKDELKITLEKYLTSGSLLSKVEYQLKEVNELNKSLKDRVYDLEKEKEEILIKLGYDLSSSKENLLSESNRSNFPTNQRSMIQIQSYMKEIGNLLDLKRQDAEKRRKNYDKLKISIECLENHL